MGESKRKRLAAEKMQLVCDGLQTAGGRVLGVTAAGQDLAGAIDGAYQAARHIRFDGMHYRTDIGQQSLSLLNTK